MSSILPKNELENVNFCPSRNFSFIFWENWKNQKALSKLTSSLFHNFWPLFFVSQKVPEKEADYFKATRTCEEDKGHLISLEDTEEIERLYKKENGTKDVTFFTSALYFSFENEWRWMSESSNNLFVTSKNETTNSPIHEFKEPESLLNPLFNGVLFLI